MARQERIPSGPPPRRFSETLANLDETIGDLTDEERDAVALAAEEHGYAADAIAAALPSSKRDAGREFVGAAMHEAVYRDISPHAVAQTIKAGLPSLAAALDGGKSDHKKGGKKKKASATDGKHNDHDADAEEKNNTPAE